MLAQKETIRVQASPHADLCPLRPLHARADAGDARAGPILPGQDGPHRLSHP